jgi:hypothetical protein
MYGGSHFAIVALPFLGLLSQESEMNSSFNDSAITCALALENAALFLHAEVLICCGAPTAFGPALTTAIYLLQARIFTAAQSPPSLLFMCRYQIRLQSVPSRPVPLLNTDWPSLRQHPDNCLVTGKPRKCSVPAENRTRHVEAPGTAP